MAPTYYHGKGSRVILSTVDASSSLTTATVTQNVDTPEVTCFTDDVRAYIAGQRDATITLDGMFDGSTAFTSESFASVRSALGSTAEVLLTVIPGGPGGSTVTPGSPARIAATRITSFEIGAPALNVVNVKVGTQVTGRLGYGRTLYGPGAAKTATFTGTAVDSGIVSGTTGGGIAQFHVTASSGSVSALTIKVQHSPDNASWSDLVSSTASGIGSIGSGSAPAAKQVSVTGTVYRYTRVNVTTFTGGASKSIRLVASFARGSKY